MIALINVLEKGAGQVLFYNNHTQKGMALPYGLMLCDAISVLEDLNDGLWHEVIVADSDGVVAVRVVLEVPATVEDIIEALSYVGVVCYRQDPQLPGVWIVADTETASAHHLPWALDHNDIADSALLMGRRPRVGHS